MPFYKQNTGKLGENIAQNYLQGKGYLIIYRNYRCRLGEIDIIAISDNKLHFIEVKTKSNLKQGYPYEEISKSKISHIKRSAMFFLLNNKYKSYKLSIDVVSIIIDGSNNPVNIKYFEGVDM